jgi:hypothetical protein
MAAEAILRQVAMPAEWAGDALVHMHHLLLSKTFVPDGRFENTKVEHLATQAFPYDNGKWGIV